MKEDKEKEFGHEICLQCLRSYNEGELIFKWYAIEDWDTFYECVDDFKAYVKKIKKFEPEELMVADYSDFPNMGEYPDYEKVNEFWEFCKKEDYEIDAIIAYMDIVGQDCFEIENFEEAYQGKYDSELDFTYELVDDCYDIEKMLGNLSNYFDYQSFSNDLFMTDYYYDGGYVFRNI